MKETAPPRTAATLGTLVVFVGYFVALHALVVTRALPSLLVLLVVAPWIAAAGSVLLGTERIRWSRSARVALLAVALVLLGAAGWRLAMPLASRADLVLYVENLVFLLMLSAFFAVSLRPGREALVTRLARIVRNGDMPPTVVRYTRQVTAAWAAFFAVAALVSTMLFMTQPRTLWSTFVNLAIWPLSIGLFVLEYAVRRLVLNEVPHVPMMSGVHAFRKHARPDPRGPS